MAIKIIKLITGEELLAEVPNEFAVEFQMKNPVRIVVMPNKLDPKTPNIGFAPWAEFSDDKDFVIDRKHIVAIMTPIRQFVDQYNGMFGKIVTPPSGLILPS